MILVKKDSENIRAGLISTKTCKINKYEVWCFWFIFRIIFCWFWSNQHLWEVLNCCLNDEPWTRDSKTLKSPFLNKLFLKKPNWWSVFSCCIWTHLPEVPFWIFVTMFVSFILEQVKFLYVVFLYFSKSLDVLLSGATLWMFNLMRQKKHVAVLLLWDWNESKASCSDTERRIFPLFLPDVNVWMNSPCWIFTVTVKRLRLFV